jgi:alpha-methylacyl-CoA racemase
VAIDLKHPDGVETVLRMVERADALIEGFRPGVTERLGLGPEVCFARNQRLVYGRMTGWGQEGPYAQAAGHDINYIALSGALDAVGRSGAPPTPPLNLVGDFGGGAMFLVVGVLAAIVEARASGQGQIVDTAMVDGSAVLMGMFHSFVALGLWSWDRGTNLLDSGAPFYDAYECSDGRYISVGALEPQFYDELVRRIGVKDDPLLDPTTRMDRARWPAMKERMAAIFKSRTRDEWCGLLEGSDACFAPVLTMAEAPAHPHNQVRGTFTQVDGVMQAAPAPRFSRTPGAIRRPPPVPGQHTEEALVDWGLTAAEVAKLRDAGAFGATG